MGKDLELGKRIAWLRTNRGMEQKEAAAGIDILYGTYQLYEYGNHPNRRNIGKILKFYKCNLSWLLTGEGDPYPDVPAAGLESRKAAFGAVHISGGGNIHVASERGSPFQPVTGSTYNNKDTPTAEFSIADDLALAARVLESRTHYAIALHLNIRSFAAAINDIAALRQVGDLQARLQALEANLNAIQKENKALRSELNLLKLAHEAPDGGKGDPAAASEKKEAM